MKAIKFRFMTVFLASLLLLLSVSCFSSCSSRNTAKFEFELKDAKVEFSELIGAPYLTVTVITTCVSGRLYEKEYPHNAEGGKPWLILSDEHHCDAQRLSPCEAFAKKQPAKQKCPQRAYRLIGKGKMQRHAFEHLLPQNRIHTQRQHLQRQKGKRHSPLLAGHI